ncbi:helix-turn-helix domain-containing protein [Bacillus sp. Bva_UNVM-123]|uniref:helix-turn-helix domain-containing protein n=1 Tax=Bacillus sp. Bva_UNVM-123 TaxID=2829798 RepID=UPI00391F6587
MTEIGSVLKEARLAKGMSLDELQDATKIQKRYLIGIEEGNYSMMPGQFYVRAFIKQYAEAVGLLPEELFEQFKSEIPSPLNEDIPEKLSRVQSRKNIAPGNSKLFDILPKILIIVFIIGAFAVFYYFFQQKDSGKSPQQTDDQIQNEQVNVEESENFTKDNEKDSDKNTEDIDEEENKEEEVVPETKKQEITVAESGGTKTVYELKNADKFELKVVSTGETWVNVKNGKGVSLFQGTLKSKQPDNDSQTFDFSNETEAVIRIGRSTETEIYVNDEKIDFAISPAQAVRQDITIRYFPNNE